MTDPPPVTQVPQDLLIIAEIGAGSSAVVYRARREATGEIVALKQWRGVLDEHARAGFLREVEVLQELAGHPNILQLKSAQAPQDAPAWLVTELCEQSLADRLRRGAVPLAEAFAIADDILCGLAAIHDAGHLHRDLKPENVLLTGASAKLADLGLTAPVGRGTSNRSAGTAPYVAPELAGNQPSELSDIYAAALTLDQLFGDAAPPDVQKLLVRASSSKPSDRVQDALSFRRSLASLSPVGTSAPRTMTPADPPVTADRPAPALTRRRPSRWVLVSAAITALLTVGAATGWATGVVSLRKHDQTKTDTAWPGSKPATSGSAAAMSSLPIMPSASSIGLPSASSTSQGSVKGLSGAKPTAEGRRPKVTSSGRGGPALTTTKPATKKPTARTTTAVPAAVTFTKQDCLNASDSGGLDIPEGVQNSGGPNHVPSECTAIYLQLTDVSYITYARACPEIPGTKTSCGPWVFLEDHDVWNVLISGVDPGTQWRLDMKAEGPETVRFRFSNA